MNDVIVFVNEFGYTSTEMRSPEYLVVSIPPKRTSPVDDSRQQRSVEVFPYNKVCLTKIIQPETVRVGFNGASFNEANRQIRIY